jgi:hypothetical protein
MIADRPKKYNRFSESKNHPGERITQPLGAGCRFSLPEPLPGLTRKTARQIKNVV